MGHELVIKSLHDAQLECTCGGWHIVYTGAMSRERAQAEHGEHVTRMTISQQRTNQNGKDKSK